MKMPSLYQVQNYIKNRRGATGDNNDLNELKTFFKPLNLQHGNTSKDAMFIFGEKLGIQK